MSFVLSLTKIRGLSQVNTIYLGVVKVFLWQVIYYKHIVLGRLVTSNLSSLPNTIGSQVTIRPFSVIVFLLGRQQIWKSRSLYILHIMVRILWKSIDYLFSRVPVVSRAWSFPHNMILVTHPIGLILNHGPILTKLVIVFFFYNSNKKFIAWQPLMTWHSSVSFGVWTSCQNENRSYGNCGTIVSPCLLTSLTEVLRFPISALLIYMAVKTLNKFFHFSSLALAAWETTILPVVSHMHTSQPFTDWLM